jgi:hypothetical protein
MIYHCCEIKAKNSYFILIEPDKEVLLRQKRLLLHSVKRADIESEIVGMVTAESVMEAIDKIKNQVWTIIAKCTTALKGPRGEPYWCEDLDCPVHGIRNRSES